MVKRVGKTFMANGSWQNFFIQAEKILWKSGINKVRFGVYISKKLLLLSSDN